MTDRPLARVPAHTGTTLVRVAANRRPTSNPTRRGLRRRIGTAGAGTVGLSAVEHARNRNIALQEHVQLVFDRSVFDQYYPLLD